MVLTNGMPIEGEYEPSTAAWVRDQVEEYESSGGTRGTTLRDSGLPVVIITNRGARSGKVRKTPLMRVEHDGRYAAVASQGGAPAHPYWYYNFRAHPEVELQDGPARGEFVAREVTGDERRLVDARGGGLPAVRRVPGADLAADPGVRARARRRGLTAWPGPSCAPGPAVPPLLPRPFPAPARPGPLPRDPYFPRHRARARTRSHQPVLVNSYLTYRNT